MLKMPIQWKNRERSIKDDQNVSNFIFCMLKIGANPHFSYLGDIHKWRQQLFFLTFWLFTPHWNTFLPLVWSCFASVFYPTPLKDYDVVYGWPLDFLQSWYVGIPKGIMAPALVNINNIRVYMPL